MSMEAALLKGEFQFYLQPNVDQFTKEIQGAEALVRWVHPEKGVLKPGAFMPTLEKSGFITKLDRYVFEQVCIFQSNRRIKRKKTVPISVNLSRVDLNDETLFAFLQETLKKHQVPPTLIHLEIAASAFANNVEHLSAVVTKLRDADFYVGIDNVGKDQVSQEVLKDVPSDALKLDITAINGGEEDTQGKQDASSVLRMGHMNDKNILVGSVETEEQASYLKYIGFRNAQGFLYYKPMPVDDFEKLLAPKKKAK